LQEYLAGLNRVLHPQQKISSSKVAYFNPVSIRKTSKRHGLKTDAAFRFERGTDPNITKWALKRAIMLIKEVAGGKISSDITDVIQRR